MKYVMRDDGHLHIYSGWMVVITLRIATAAWVNSCPPRATGTCHPTTSSARVWRGHGKPIISPGMQDNLLLL